MAKTKDQKKQLVEAYSSKITNAKAIVILKAKGVTPNEVNEFKKNIFDFGAEINVVKNTLFKIALKNSELEEEKDLDFGEHSVVFMSEDIITPSKELKKFIENTKQNKDTFKIEIISGFIDGTKLTKEQAIELSEMPDKSQSISMLLGILDNPLSSVVNVIEDPVRSIISIMDQAFKE